MASPQSLEYTRDLGINRRGESIYLAAQHTRSTIPFREIEKVFFPLLLKKIPVSSTYIKTCESGFCMLRIPETEIRETV
ncbi:hypothetical protein TNIN_407661 [Trichonephila inaurata madagascariensis]|uniref:Uncharacterized protein n=1 Tax=Trichonephila inaurata madagascariensis TaxID=2747483 RepID=A0A8X7C3A1_9ARAC|nr:hypothetical protein TNIN_407661 [Trichonephila inaurata madagascariensis]